MKRRRIPSLAPLLIAIAAMLLMAPAAVGQTTFSDALIVDGGAEDEPFVRFDAGPADDLMSWLWAREDGRLEFGVDGHRFWNVFPDAHEDTLTLDSFGFGVGTTLPIDAIHVYADGSDFDRARILIEDANDAAGLRTLLKMINKGGSRIQFLDSRNQRKWFAGMENNGHFNLRMPGDDKPQVLLKRTGVLEIKNNDTRVFKLAASGNLEITGTLTQSSDRNLKDNVAPIDRREILTRVADLPISTWNFRFDDPTLRHMGPMAQDFHAAFGLGANETTIAPVDAIGVTLAAVQALHEEGTAKDERIAELEDALVAQRAETDALAARLAKLESLLAPTASTP